MIIFMFLDNFDEFHMYVWIYFVFFDQNLIFAKPFYVYRYILSLFCMIMFDFVIDFRNVVCFFLWKRSFR